MLSTIRISGINYIIELIPDLSEEQECTGKVIGKKCKILLDKDMCEDMILATLLHEVIEIINGENQLKLEHHVIQTLATQIYQVLQDNKTIFQKNLYKRLYPEWREV